MAETGYFGGRIDLGTATIVLPDTMGWFGPGGPMHPDDVLSEIAKADGIHTNSWASVFASTDATLMGVHRHIILRPTDHQSLTCMNRSLDETRSEAPERVLDGSGLPGEGRFECFDRGEPSVRVCTAILGLASYHLIFQFPKEDRSRDDRLYVIDYVRPFFEVSETRAQPAGP